LVHQSVVVMPHWLVEADKEGRWSVTMQMSLDTRRAEKQNNHAEEAVATV
jgi:4-alpha-glucanotransferase